MPSVTTFQDLGQFKKIENIFRMFKSAEELAAEKIADKGGTKGEFAKSIYRIFIDLEGGIKPASKMIEEIGSLFSSGSQGIEERKKMFNNVLDFYSSAPGGILSDIARAPYVLNSTESPSPSSVLTNNQIYGLVCEDPGDNKPKKPVSFISFRSPYFSISNRDVNAVETFLNFLPGTVISRCVPYVDMEILFNRDAGADDTYLQGPSLIRFLTDDKKVSEFTRIDSMMINARKSGTKSLIGEGARELHSAGMELFLSPQSLTNMSGKHETRSFEVLDRTRPLISLENLTINVDPTTGSNCNKRATATLKLHDRSRLSEVADLLQLNGVNRVSFWLTYGWRHPTDSPQGPDEAQTYGKFINEKMLIKEAFNLVNASYAFDQSGQVTITIEMYTQGFLDAMTIGIEETGEFAKIRKKQKELVSLIAKLRDKYNFSSLGASAKEVRPFMILNSAAGGTFPSLEEGEIKKAIDDLVAILTKMSTAEGGMRPNPEDIKALEENLKEYYSVSTTKKGEKKTSFDAQRVEEAEKEITKKFDFMSKSHDPFIAFDEKNAAREGDTGKAYVPAYKSSLGSLIAASKGSDKKVVSFGKLFASFMVPAINASDFVDESQIFFYTINDKAALASSIPISEFPIVLEDFKAKYTEWVEKRGSSSMTMHEFVDLAVRSNFKNLSSPAFGFSPDLLTKEKEKAKEVKDLENFQASALSLNNGRGPFQYPEISIYTEMVFSEEDGVKSFDRLELYEKSATFKNPKGGAKKILRVHIVDTGAIPDASRLFAYRSEFGKIELDERGVPDTSRVNVGTNNQEIAESRRKVNASERQFVFVDKTTMGETASTREATISSKETLRQAIAYSFPTLIPGMNASAIIEATVASKSDPAAKAAILTAVKSGRELSSGPRGADIGNLPVRVIPSEVSMRTLGCPLISFAQNFFVDMNTGTTIDNVYSVTQITHSFASGKFETTFKLAPWDSYARIENADTTIRSLVDVAQEVFNKANGQTTSP